MSTSSGSTAPATPDNNKDAPAVLLEGPSGTTSSALAAPDTVAQLEKLSLQHPLKSTTEVTMEGQEPANNTEMLSAPTAISVPSASQVFAPRPIRVQFPVVYRPIPQRLSRSVLVQLDDSPMARSPSPVASQPQHRRSSSAASTLNPWNLVRMESKLVAGEASEAEEAKESGESSNLLQLYSSPPKDVLDELYKIIRNNKSYPFSNFRELSATSPSPSFYRTRTPTKTPSSPSQQRRRISDAPTPDNQLIARSPPPEREWQKIPFPSSPISRTTMRNPILFNAQFGTATAE